MSATPPNLGSSACLINLRMIPSFKLLMKKLNDTGLRTDQPGQTTRLCVAHMCLGLSVHTRSAGNTLYAVYGLDLMLHTAQSAEVQTACSVQLDWLYWLVYTNSPGLNPGGPWNQHLGPVWYEYHMQYTPWTNPVLCAVPCLVCVLHTVCALQQGWFMLCVAHELHPTLNASHGTGGWSQSDPHTNPAALPDECDTLLYVDSY